MARLDTTTRRSRRTPMAHGGCGNQFLGVAPCFRLVHLPVTAIRGGKGDHCCELQPLMTTVLKLSAWKVNKWTVLIKAGIFHVKEKTFCSNSRIFLSKNVKLGPLRLSIHFCRYRFTARQLPDRAILWHHSLFTIVRHIVHCFVCHTHPRLRQLLFVYR